MSPFPTPSLLRNRSQYEDAAFDALFIFIFFAFYIAARIRVKTTKHGFYEHIVLLLHRAEKN
jgi:hypothetical protein